MKVKERTHRARWRLPREVWRQTCGRVFGNFPVVQIPSLSQFVPLLVGIVVLSRGRCSGPNSSYLGRFLVVFFRAPRNGVRRAAALLGVCGASFRIGLRHSR